MAKSRKPPSSWKKKHRITPGLKRFNDERRFRRLHQSEGDAPHESQVNITGQHNSSVGSVSQPNSNFSLNGRRIVNIFDLTEQIKQLDNHSPCNCSFKDMEAVREKRLGLKSGFIFKCKMCNFTQTIWSEKSKPAEMDVNTSAVSGTIATGGGHSQLEEFLFSMNVPPMSDKTFRKYEQVVGKGWMATASAEMESAAAEEASLARECGDVDKDGTPLITVVADGSWCKRSYRTNYSSLSGVAAIVGYKTKKVLYIGVKNKYCTPCARAENRPANKEESKPHVCYKNWGLNQSSTSMEAAIICEGFTKSEEMYGVRYARLIADGDSSVYKKIVESRPYKSVTVEKVECKNHLMRNMCNKLKSLATTRTQRSSVYLRKKIGDNIMRCRVAVQKATEHRKSEELPLPKKIDNLRQDILNVPSHVFGEHKCCAERGYFCELDSLSAPQELNFVPRMTHAGLHQPITDIFRDLSRHSRSLIIDVTSNNVEHYNSIIAKFIGGKRINFALRGSYQGRCSAAVVQYNSGTAHYRLHKQMYKASPGFFTKSTELKRKRKVERQKGRKRCKKTLFSENLCDPDYGIRAQRPDIDKETLATECEEFLEKLKKTDEELKSIERETIHQSDSSQWLEMRRKLLTASNFGQVCNMRQHTGCESLVKQLLYSTFDCKAMAYGRNNEDVARQEVGNELGLEIERCGLIDKEYPFLGASPDGLTNDNGIVEIKCPSSAKDLTPDEAIRKRKVTFWSLSKSGEIGEVKKSHKFFYQVQGQLHITGRQHCYFAVWTKKGTKITKIYKDDEFWNSMFEKLNIFYKTCILPELIDPRHCRSMPIRNPPHIIEAQKKLFEKRIKTTR